MAQYQFITLEGNHQIAQSREFSTTEERDQIMQDVTAWWRMQPNQERYKIIHDSFALECDHTADHRITRFYDREQRTERVFIYRIIQTAS